MTDSDYTAKECIEYAVSCIKNRDSRDCTLLWLSRALARYDEEISKAQQKGEHDAQERSTRM